MQSNKDIYQKDQPHFPRRRHSGAAAPGSPSRARNMYSDRERPATLGEAPPHISRRRHRSRRHRTGQMTLGNRILLSALFIFLVGYLGVLGYYRLYKPRQEAAVPAPSPEPEGTPAELVSAAPEVLSDNLMERARMDALAMEKQVSIWREAQVAYDRALTDMGRGDAAAAIGRIRAAIGEAPEHIGLQLLLADMLIEQKEFEEARDVLVRVLQAAPERTPARVKLASVLHQLKRYEAALEIAAWIMETEPYLEEANQLAATAYMQIGRVDSAVPHWRRLVALNRDNIMAQNNLAVAYSRLGDYDKAITLFRDVLAADNSNSITYYNLAVCYAQKGDAVHAVDTLARAADVFGESFVSAWFRSRDFDAIRDEQIFETFEQEIGSSAGL